jgi:hypothetical protein
MFEITAEELKDAVEKPDKMMDCQVTAICCFYKNIENKGELIAIAEKGEDGVYDIKTFGWLEKTEDLVNRVMFEEKNSI